MRILAAAVALALSAALARADAPRPPSPAVPLDPLQAVEGARERFLQCTAAAAKAGLRGSSPAPALADSALGRCRTPEQALARALRRQLGVEGAERVLERVRESDRANLVRIIETLRAGTTPQ